MYGSAKKNIFKMLDLIHHQGLRIALGAFRTSPVQSLYAEAGEPSLKHRRQKLSMNYFLKLKSLPENPCFDSVFNASPPEFFEKSKSDPAFGARTLPHIQNSEINYKKIDDSHVRTPPPWEESRIFFDTSLNNLKKDETNEVIYRKEFCRIREGYSGSYEAFTDGSKQDQRVGAAAFYPKNPDESDAVRLRDGSSIYNAELEGILLALNKFKTLKRLHSHFTIHTDSLSAVEGLRNRNFVNKNVRRIFNLIRDFPSRVHISIVWIPAHVGISGNETVDKLAKAALMRAVSIGKLLCWSDLKCQVNTYISSVWQESWDGEVRNKLHEVLPKLNESLSTDGTNRKNETVLCRLRIGHTWITHSYLLKKEDQPFCHGCDSFFTVKHFLVECSDFHDTRIRFYNVTDMYRLFREVRPSKVLNFVKEIGIYGKI